MLICENVRVRYGEACVLAGVDLRIRAGEWWMLIGPNGAGKSTLVNAIARSVPYEGRVLFNGVDTRSLRHAQFARHIGVLSQRNLANYAFRVEEIVRMGATPTAACSAGGDPESARYVEEALRVTGAFGRCATRAFSRSPAASYSGSFLRRCLPKTPTC